MRDFGSAGAFTFTVAAQDGIRVYVDVSCKTDLWKNVSTTVRKTVNVTVPSDRHTLGRDPIDGVRHLGPLALSGVSVAGAAPGAARPRRKPWQRCVVRDVGS